MWSGNTTDTAGLLGLSYVGTVCSNYKYLISEDEGALTYTTVVSHEIGHK